MAIKEKETKVEEDEVQLVEQETVEETEKLVTIRIKKDDRNPGDNIVPVGINGRFWEIERGVATEVPTPVYDLLLSAGYI